jgi:hypothetical protein
MSKDNRGEMKGETKGAPRGETREESREESAGGVFEGSAHVLRGLEQQLVYWESLQGHEAAQKEMAGVLRVAARALREALKRAKAVDPA